MQKQSKRSMIIDFLRFLQHEPLQRLVIGFLVLFEFNSSVELETGLATRNDGLGWSVEVADGEVRRLGTQ
jgi:hypothetical protein